MNKTPPHTAEIEKLIEELEETLEIGWEDGSEAIDFARECNYHLPLLLSTCKDYLKLKKENEKHEKDWQELLEIKMKYHIAFKETEKKLNKLKKAAGEMREALEEIAKQPQRIHDGENLFWDGCPTTAKKALQEFDSLIEE